MPVKLRKPPFFYIAAEHGRNVNLEVTMSLTPNARRRQAWAFRIGRQNGLRTSNDAIDQLQQELIAEREQHAFDVAEMQKSIDMLLRDLARAKYELARRDMVDAFANAPSPSLMKH